MRLKWKHLFIAAILTFAALSLVSCKTESTSEFPDGQSLENLLTKEYDLNDLESFIKIGNTNRLAYPDKPLDIKNIVFYHDLDREYPIEVFRIADDYGSAAYTVYKVSQGGYYYVFWSFAFPEDETEPVCDWSDTEHMCVFFSTHIGKPRNNILQYLSIHPGRSTAADVLALDPNSEYLDMSYERSYCFLNQKYALGITYKKQELYKESPDFEHLVVDRIEIVPREDIRGCIGFISPEDLPK